MFRLPLLSLVCPVLRKHRAMAHRRFTLLLKCNRIENVSVNKLTTSGVCGGRGGGGGGGGGGGRGGGEECQNRNRFRQLV